MMETTPDKDKQLEKFTLQVETLIDKGVKDLNEDALFVSARRFGVFDGASGLDGYVDENRHTGGYKAAHIAASIFKEEISLKEATVKANELIKKSMIDAGIDINKKVSWWNTTMAVIDIDSIAEELEWIQIADALIVLVYEDGAHKLLVEDNYDHDRPVMIKWRALADQGRTNIRQELNDDILALRESAGVVYGALNGDSQALDFVRSGRVSLKGVRNVLIFTDGLIPLKTDPNNEDDFTELISEYRHGGLELAKEWLRNLENNDPDCIQYPRYKKSDDIAAVAITLEK